MSGGRRGRGSGRGGRGGGGGGRGGGGGGAPGSPGAGGGMSPVEFALYASHHFAMEGCPALVRPPHPSQPDSLCRLTMPDRSVLGDIVLFFAAAAVAEPTARLVMWQASKQDKAWLSGYVEAQVPQLECSTLDVGTNKFIQFTLRQGIVPTPLSAAAASAPVFEPAAAAAAAAPAAASPAEPPKAPAAQVKDAATAAAAKVQEVAHEAAAAVHSAAEGAAESLAAASHKAKEHAAAASDAAKSAAAVASDKAKAAAAAAREGLSDAALQVNGAAGAVGDKARTWFTDVQAAMHGEKGPRAQQVALGSTVAAAALAITGVALSVIFGRRHGSGSRR